MIIYLLFFSQFFFDFSSNKKYVVLFKKIVEIYACLLLICFCGLRYYTGADWYGYIHYYNEVDWSNNEYEIGYKLLNILCKTIFDNYYSVQFITSAFFIFSVFKFLKKYSNYFFFVLF